MKTVLVDGQAITPNKVVCVGRNFVEHIAELGNEMPEQMVIFNKPNSAIAEQLIAFHQEPLHYEGELCFMFRDGRFSAVGFGLDLTKRALQSKLKNKGLPWERAKAFTGAALFSDFVSINEISDDLSLALSIDDQLIQAGGVDLMIYKPAQILEELLSFMTLDDGDIVMTGTPKGVGVIHRGARFHGKVLQGDKVLVSGQWQAQ